MKNCCKNCNEELKGRVDKKFCNSYCKSAFHYEVNKKNENTMFVTIDKLLKFNRRILKEYNKSGKATVRKETLITAGFNPKYFTHYWRNNKNEAYLFCYEFGFRAIKTGNIEKYVLIKWQPYMQ